MLSFDNIEYNTVKDVLNDPDNQIWVGPKDLYTYPINMRVLDLRNFSLSSPSASQIKYC